MKQLLLLALLLQDPNDNLELDRRQTIRSSPNQSLITLLAEYPDGSPVYPGTIGCSGYWFKHIDEDTLEYAEGYEFATDARGAIILNPPEGLDGLSCIARAPDGRSRIQGIWLDLHGTYLFTLPTRP